MTTPTAPSPLLPALAKPITVGGREIANRLWLAPMAGLGHVAHREVVDSYGGCGLLFTEMCTARGLDTEKPQNSPVFRWRAEELDRLVCQLLGGDPVFMALAARRVEREGFFGVDVNMGCAVSGIVKRGAGADLLREPDRAVAVVRSIRQAVSLPLFVKFRTGWSVDPAPAVDLAKRLEDAGADCLTFHPRVAPDLRTRPPRLDHLRLIKAAVTIPVIGNGDVVLPEDCQRMLDLTGCDGVALGRAAVCRPWIFAQWVEGFEPGQQTFQQCALRLADALEIHFDPSRAVTRFKKFAVFFAANYAFGHALLPKLTQGKTMAEMRANVLALLGQEREMTHRPNSLLFTY